MSSLSRSPMQCATPSGSDLDADIQPQDAQLVSATQEKNEARNEIDTGIDIGLDKLRRERNEKALRFLTSITTSSTTAEAGKRAMQSTARNNRDNVHFDFDPQGILETRISGGHFRTSEAGDSPYNTGSRQRLPGSGGGTRPYDGEYSNAVKTSNSNSSEGVSQSFDYGPMRRISYNQIDHTEARNAYHRTEFSLMKPSSFPMVFASIKPFVGKGDERGRYGKGDERGRYGGSSAADGAQKSGGVENKKDQSFAHLLYQLRTLEPESELEASGTGANVYQPNRLDDPGLHKGLQRTVLGLTGYMGTVFEYTRPDDLRQELNDHFRETHPEIYAVGLTLDQIRRLRAHMLRVTREQDLELSTAAIGWVYFEKLIWKGYVTKDNRKLVAAVCLFLALKINESREVPISRSLQAIQRRFEVSSNSILDQEFSVFAELDFSLWVPRREFMPHFLRMFEVIVVPEKKAVDSDSEGEGKGKGEDVDMDTSHVSKADQSSDAEFDAGSSAGDSNDTSHIEFHGFRNANHKHTSSMIPIAPKVPKTAEEQRETSRLIVILEAASLETYKVGKSKDAKYQLLNCDDHQGILARMGRDIAESRPDITHQCLLTLLDSPLNKTGRLQVYIHTKNDVLIEISPSVRIPRTFKRFSGLMVQLLHKMSIRSVNGHEKLLKVIKNPVSQYLPPDSLKLTFSYDAPTVHLQTWMRRKLKPGQDIVVAIGALAHGSDDFADAYVDEKIGISEYPLSASVACGKLTCGLEDIWGIL
ncbi:18S rRNA pseudouridine methyltransferase [Coemansia sp. RSA 1721]|nr:18S rRNA pseudouridine methyltransferase [Coemansia sp. RSA 1721]